MLACFSSFAAPAAFSSLAAALDEDIHEQQCDDTILPENAQVEINTARASTRRENLLYVVDGEGNSKSVRPIGRFSKRYEAGEKDMLKTLIQPKT